MVDGRLVLVGVSWVVGSGLVSGGWSVGGGWCGRQWALGDGWCMFGSRLLVGDVWWAVSGGW